MIICKNRALLLIAKIIANVNFNPTCDRRIKCLGTTLRMAVDVNF